MNIRKIISKLNFRHLSIFPRDGQFVVVDHDTECIEYQDCVGIILARVEVDFSTRRLIDRGINVIASYRSKKGHKAWLVGMESERAAKLRTRQQGVKIELIDALE